MKKCSNCRWQIPKDRPRRDPCMECSLHPYNDGSASQWKRRKLWQIMRAINNFFEKRRRLRNGNTKRQ